MLTPKQPMADVAVWSLAAVGVAVAAVLLLVLAGVAPIDRDGERASSAVVPRTVAPPPEPPATREPARVSTSSPQRTTAPPPAPAQLALTVTATRGDSWISARLDSETGRVLEERLLAQGESVRLSGRRIWLLVGASGNVDVLVNGKARRLAPGTIETVFTPPAT